MDYCVGGRSSFQGFLLLEAASALGILVVVSTLIFSWQAHLIQSYQKTSQNMQALCVARTLVEQIKAGNPPCYALDLWQVDIVIQGDALLPIRYCRVSVSARTQGKKAPPLVTLTTACTL